ncbi:right-handed parallel beta-helix repeat-containing protein [uncultured Methanobrevibacter sp.]|uniref:right-handed parallel beta-helix repeat-containing protein n=1 Tax=uncultured Methanobrevibacter sp. TaxID=253161 RepID=UPI00262DB647|nr:right-handed parallel beta-helix repeat-containing protein [uncultured Methanobrevibacter sp.]
MASSNEINLKDCLIENVTGSTSGNGAIVYMSGSGKYNMDGVVINNVSMGDISGDYSFMRDVIYVYSSTATVTLTNSKITNAHGPMQAIIENKATMTLENVTIINNIIGVTKAGGQGTAILYNGVRATKLNASQCLIANNEFEIESGVVLYEYSSANDFNVEYCAIYNNTGSTTLVGGTTSKIVADYNYWGSNDAPTGVTVNNWVIENNGVYTLNNGDALAKDIPVLIEEPEQPVITTDAIYVAVDGNDNNTGAADAPVATIAKAVELAKNTTSGQIIITEGTYSENGITIDGETPITIIGQGNVVIDNSALGTTNVFTVTTTNATFKNIRFTNIKKSHGAAIYVKGQSKTNLLDANVLIEDCIFDNITANRGVIYAYYTKGNISISNCTFTNIEATWGAVCAYQSAYDGGLNLVISESTFANNHANNAGALYIQASRLTVTDSDFNNNSAEQSPGVIYLTNTSATFDNCRICNNHALRTATVMSVNAGIVSSNPTVLKASDVIITNCIIENNTADEAGAAAIYLENSNLDISYSSIVNELNIKNTVTATYGTEQPGNVTANNNWWGTNNPLGTIDGINIALDKWVILNVEANATEVQPGDAVAITVDFNHVNTTSGEIEELTGGAIPKTYDVSLTSTSGTITPATLEIANGATKSAIYNVADIDAVISIACQNAVINMSFAPAAEPYYGIIYVSKSGDDANNGSAEAPVATIAKAIELALVEGGSGQIIVSEGTYTGYDYHVNGDLTITGVGNVILDGENQGRLFYMNYGDAANKIAIANLTVTGVKHNYGAFVYSLANELIIDNVTVINNEGIGSLIKNNGKMTIKDSTFRNMTSGTLIDISGNGDILINNTVIENITVDTSGTSNYGIIYAGGRGTLTIESSKFNDNTVRQSVIRDSGYTNIAIKQSEFINNHMAGSYADGGVVYSNNVLTVEESKFINNDACGNGGAISVGSRGDATITKSVFINNSAASGKKGNAIFNGNKLSITYSVLLSNETGAVIYHDGEYVLNALYNWWGTNDNPQSLIGVGTYENDWGDDVDCEFDASKWVIMTVSNNATSDISIGDKVAFTVDFTHYTDTTATVYDLADSIPEVDVSASALKGEMDKQVVTTQNNVANFVYTASDSGNDTVTIASANAVNETEINVKEPVVIDVIYVSMSGDDNNNGSQSAPVATIAKAIELAQFGKIVILNGNYVIGSTLVVDKDLDIEGRGTVTIDGNQLGILENSANLNLTNIIFTNAKLSTGAVIKDSGNTTINGCTFYSCVTTGGSSAGPINNMKGTMTINNSKFYQNKGARGVVASQQGTRLIINNSEFYDNDCTSITNCYGIVYSTSAETTVENTVFRNNKVKQGAGIWASRSTSATVGSLDVINCTFENNIANVGTGGAVFGSGSVRVNIEKSTFINNTAIKSASGVGGNGGAIYSTGTSKFTVIDSVFIDNAGDADAGVYADGDAFEISNSVILAKANDTNFALNKVGATVTANDNFWGDNTKANTNANVARWVIMNATYTASDDEVLTITAAFDKTNSTGGEIADYAGKLPDGFTVAFTSSTGLLNENVVVSNGQATTIYTRDEDDSYISVKAGNAEVLFEFAVLPDVVYVSTSGSDDNTGYEDSPVATLAKALELAKKGQIVILEGTYTTGNLGMVMDGDLNITGVGKVIIDAQNNNRILYVGQDANVVLKNLILVNGYGDTESGALLGNSNELTLINCTLANSSAGDNNGGAIFNVGKLTIINSTIANNTAKTGGAIFTQDTMAKGATITIINSVIANNTATGNDNNGGGAIFAQQIAGMTIENTTFENNKALTDSSGGAIFISHSEASLKISGSEFIANHANGKTDVGGGAIYMVGTSNYERKGTLTITNTLFEDNTADYNGGAIYARATTVNIANSVLINNTDANGLAIYGYKTEQVSPKITANDNWWGSNDNPSDLVGGNGYKPTVSRWAVLTITNDTPISAGNTVRLTVSINTYTTGTENGTLASPINVARSVTIKTTSGNIEGLLENGEFTTDYTVPSGLKIISASVDNENVVLFVITSETTVEVDDIVADKGDNVEVTVNVKTDDGTIINIGNVELYFGDDLIATVPVINGVANTTVMITKDIGNYTITAKYIDLTEEFANNESTATLSVVGINNIVTPENFNNFFDENGVLKSDVPFDELVFDGEFKDLGTLTINKAINITGDVAVFNNTALKITANNVKVSNMEFVADKLFDDKAVIYVTGKDVVLENNTIDYDAPNTGDAYAVYADSADGLNMVDNKIFFDGKLGEDTKTIAVYAIDSDNMVVKDNIIDSTVPSVAVGYGPAPDYAPTIMSAGAIFEGCKNLTFEDNTVSVDYNQSAGYSDTLYGVKVIGGDDSKIIGNDIELNGHAYAYAVSVDGENLTISDNTIESNSDDAYAAGLAIEKDSTGNVENNDISATANDVSYGVYADDWGMGSNLTFNNNNVSAESNTAYGMSVNAGETVISNNNVSTKANYTTGVAVKANATITNNTIAVNGSNVGNSTDSYPMAPVQTTGIYAQDSNVTITNNDVSSTGNKTVDLSNVNATVKDNKLKANGTKGDASITANNSTVIADNNASSEDPVPVIQIVAASKNVLYSSIYKVRITSDGKSIGAGKVVSITIAGKTVKVKTNKNGYASIKMLYKPGKYSVKVAYGNLKKTVKLNVKSIIVAKNIFGKKSASFNKITVSLRKVGGEYIKGKYVSIKFNGRTFKVKTNSKGVGVFKLNKNLFAKLPVGKKYSYKVIYGKDSVMKTINIRK